jgi:hypothetical protein
MIRKLMLAAVVALGIVGSTAQAAEYQPTWYTIVTDRGCEIASATPTAFQVAMLAKANTPSIVQPMFWPNGAFLGLVVKNMDANHKIWNQWFFTDVKTCLGAAKAMDALQK